MKVFVKDEVTTYVKKSNDNKLKNKVIEALNKIENANTTKDFSNDKNISRLSNSSQEIYSYNLSEIEKLLLLVHNKYGEDNIIALDILNYNDFIDIEKKDYEF